MGKNIYYFYSIVYISMHIYISLEKWVPQGVDSQKERIGSILSFDSYCRLFECPSSNLWLSFPHHCNKLTVVYFSILQNKNEMIRRQLSIHTHIYYSVCCITILSNMTYMICVDFGNDIIYNCQIPHMMLFKRLF